MPYIKYIPAIALCVSSYTYGSANNEQTPLLSSSSSSTSAICARSTSPIPPTGLDFFTQERFEVPGEKRCYIPIAVSKISEKSSMFKASSTQAVVYAGIVSGTHSGVTQAIAQKIGELFEKDFGYNWWQSSICKQLLLFATRKVVQENIELIPHAKRTALSLYRFQTDSSSTEIIQAPLYTAIVQESSSQPNDQLTYLFEGIQSNIHHATKEDYPVIYVDKDKVLHSGHTFSRSFTTKLLIQLPKDLFYLYFDLVLYSSSTVDMETIKRYAAALSAQCKEEGRPTHTALALKFQPDLLLACITKQEGSSS